MSAHRYRFRRDLETGAAGDGRLAVVDHALGRAMRLGRQDRAVAELLARPAGATLADIAAHLHCEVEIARRRLAALATLYVLEGPRSERRIALDAERRAWNTRRQVGPEQDAVVWPGGVDPPRHACQASGGCCGGAFLGPIRDEDADRVSLLALLPGTARVTEGKRALVGLRAGSSVLVGMRQEAGRCVAQNQATQLCEIHAEHGEMAKPTLCRQFPLRFHRSPRGVHVSLMLACTAYDRARPAAGAWQDREAEVRALLRDGAHVAKINLPIELAPGLPIGFAIFEQLSRGFHAALEGVAGHPDTPRAWLARVCREAVAAIDRTHAELAEGPDVHIASPLPGIGRALDGGRPLFDPREARLYARRVLYRQSRLSGEHDGYAGRRLVTLVGAIRGHVSGVGLAPRGRFDPDALAVSMLTDIIANDLPAHISVGHVDAGLAGLCRRVVLAEAAACARARALGRHRVDAATMTDALILVSRSEAEISALSDLSPATA